VQQQFIQTVQGCLGVKVSKCNFQRQPQQCRQQINQWVSSKTQNKMPRLVPQDGITDNTKMLVVSALQLKAKWGQQFRNHQTKQGVFQPLDSNKVKLVPVMQKRGVFKYHEDEMVKVVGIPTQGNELTMYVILPKCKKCLPEVEKEQLIEGDQLKHLLDNCDQKRAKVNVQLPKFQIKHKLDAKQTLLKKGMINMHEQNTADFSGITGCQECSQQAKYNLRRPLGQRNQLRQGQDWTKQAQIHVNKFLHQATIKVTDSGITAAGPQDIYQDSFEQQQYYGQQQNQFDQDEDDVDQYKQNPFTTGRDRFDEITGLNRFGQGLGFTKSFNAKHPFAFVVRHNPTKQVLLFGRVIDAGQKQQQSVGQWEQIQGVY
jgi:serine protease inhibitor